MKVKYFSDDGHEFESKSLCQKYEDALEEIKNITGLVMKKIDDKNWYKISSLAEFYYFDHMNSKSTNSMYAISKIVGRVNHYFPYWITKDFEDGVMIDKKRIEYIDNAINFLNEKIDSLKLEKKEIEKLRDSDINSDEYKFISEEKIQEDFVEEFQKNDDPVEKTETKNDVIPLSIEYAQSLIRDKGFDLEGVDIVHLCMDETGIDVSEWNNMSEDKRKNIIEEEINKII